MVEGKRQKALISKAKPKQTHIQTYIPTHMVCSAASHAGRGRMSNHCVRAYVITTFSVAVEAYVWVSSGKYSRYLRIRSCFAHACMHELFSVGVQVERTVKQCDNFITHIVEYT